MKFTRYDYLDRRIFNCEVNNMDKTPLANIAEESRNLSLRLAWEIFAQYDMNAIIQQLFYKRLQFYILLLGIAVTVLVLGESYFKVQLDKDPSLVNLNQGLRNLIIIFPIVISILVAISTFFKFGNKWVSLRTAAEAMKSEIYQFRARVGKYKIQLTSENQQIIKPEDSLSKQIQSISSQLMSTEVAISSLRKYEGEIPPAMFGSELSQDDGYSLLYPEDYVKVRLDTQINFYQKKTMKMYKNLQVLQILIFIAGGVGTFIAAIGFELWVALTSSLVSVFTIYLQYNQIENTLVKYNQALNSLRNIKIWWTSLGQFESNDENNIDKLVKSTEEVLLSEHQSWIINMKEAVAKIRELKEKKSDSK